MAELLGPMGRLYQVDMRLRPTGKSGSLVIPLAEFRRYYEGGGAQLWERQALTRARVVVRRRGVRPRGHGRRAEHAAYEAAVAAGAADEIRRHARTRSRPAAASADLKRGFGGIVDIEFLVQMFQLKYGRALPALRTTNTWEALDALRGAGLLSAEEHATLRDLLRLLAHGGEPAAHRPQPLARRIAGDAGGPGKAGTAAGLRGRAREDAGRCFLAELERHTT